MHLQAGEERTLELTIGPEMMQIVTDDGSLKYRPGMIKFTVGGCSPGERGLALGAPKPVTAEFEIY